VTAPTLVVVARDGMLARFYRGPLGRRVDPFSRPAGLLASAVVALLAGLLVAARSCHATCRALQRRALGRGTSRAGLGIWHGAGRGAATSGTHVPAAARHAKLSAMDAPASVPASAPSKAPPPTAATTPRSPVTAWGDPLTAVAEAKRGLSILAGMGARVRALGGGGGGGAAVITVPSGGHHCHLTEPAAVAALLHRWLLTGRV